MEKVLQNFLDEAIDVFKSYKNLADKAIAQISEEEFFKTIDAEANSIAVIVKHLGGNLRSRWTDFLTTDGEKADRNRDAEFVAESDTRASILENWENGWRILLGSLESLAPEDLAKIVQIRGEDFTVLKAVTRASTHAAYHIGQIALLAKHFRGENWETLSIPKNKSAQFNEYLAKKEDKGNYLEAAQEFAEKK